MATCIAYHLDKEGRYIADKNKKFTILVANFIYDEKPYANLSKEITTDEYGTAKVEFDLPSDIEEKDYYLKSESDEETSAYIVVADYKLPTFNVEIDRAEILNDSTNRVWYKAFTMDKRPLSTGIAECVLTNYTRNDKTKKSHETKQVDNGYFYIDYSNNKNIFYSRTNLTVTDAKQEVHAFSFDIPRNLFHLEDNLQREINTDTLKTICFSCYDISNNKQQAIMNYRIDKGNWRQARFFEPIDKKEIENYLIRGEHELEYCYKGDTISRNIITYSMNDKHLSEGEKSWFYISDEKFPSNGDPITLKVGVKDRDVCLFYTISTEKKVLEQGRMMVGDTILTRKFNYKKEYGDKLSFAYIWEKNGKIEYSYNLNVLKPEEQKQLVLSWKKIDKNLTPGQKVDWVLHVQYPDGKPAKAQLAATIYDTSLDQFDSHSWEFNCPTQSSTYSSNWEWSNISKEIYLYKSLKEDFDLEEINVDYFSNPLYGFRPYGKIRNREEKMISLSSASKNECSYNAYSDEGTVRRNSQKSRSYFSEAAFYASDLETDENGDVAISFTLPDAITTWRMMGIAHDKEINYGEIEANVSAEKDLTISMNLPRFIRKGDEPILNAVINNNSKEEKKGAISFELSELDHKANSFVIEMPEYTPIPKGETPLEFKIDNKRPVYEGLVKAEIQLFGKDFNDGEIRYIKQLSDEEEVTTSYPYILQEGEKEPSTNSFKAKGATVWQKHYANPEEFILESLKPLVWDKKEDAVSLIEAYYANNIYEALQQKKYNGSPLLKQLYERSKEDGSIARMKNMGGNRYVTTLVAEHLSRLKVLGISNSKAENLLSHTLKYLRKKLKKDIEELDKDSTKLPNENTLHTLYVYALSGDTTLNRTKIDVILNRIIAHPTAFTIYGKARSAWLLNHFGKDEQAEIWLKSLLQYSKYDKEMGRYYDTNKNKDYFGKSLISAQSAAIETLEALSPTDTTTIDEMRQWLLMSRRTQMWNTSIETADAAWALLKINRPLRFQWGAIFVKQTLPLKSIKKSGKGMQLKREIIADKNNPKKIKVRITIKADRDYDLVKVIDHRAANLEPANQLAEENFEYITMPQDTQTSYYFNQLSKGVHIIETDYLIGYKGKYQKGSCEIESALAPEFRAIAP